MAKHEKVTNCFNLDEEKCRELIAESRYSLEQASILGGRSKGYINYCFSRQMIGRKFVADLKEMTGIDLTPAILDKTKAEVPMNYQRVMNEVTQTRFAVDREREEVLTAIDKATDRIIEDIDRNIDRLIAVIGKFNDKQIEAMREMFK